MNSTEGDAGEGAEGDTDEIAEKVEVDGQGRKKWGNRHLICKVMQVYVQLLVWKRNIIQTPCEPEVALLMGSASCKLSATAVLSYSVSARNLTVRLGLTTSSSSSLSSSSISWETLMMASNSCSVSSSHARQ